MSLPVSLRRRQLLVGSSVGALMIGLGGRLATAIAQAPARPRPGVQLDALEDRARRLGIPTPVADVARTTQRNLAEREKYAELLPRLVDLIERADRAGQNGMAISDEAADLLGRVHRDERSLAPADEAERRLAPSYESLRGEYRKLFETCEIEAKYKSKVDQHVQTLRNYRSRYEKVGQGMEIPWYFIGAIHALEAGFNFRTHLHNGDPLTAKTVQVPKNRPAVWNPPTDWEASADDALRIKNFQGQTDWSLEQMLYRWELYNGFGYRNKRTSGGAPVHTPYLWSFSNQYARGKYVRDGIWDPSYVSQQCGACSMLKGLIESGDVAPL